MAKKKPNKLWSKLGVWSFMVGITVALLISFIAGELLVWSIGTLAVLGLIVGLLNITDTEISLFLLAGISFIIAASALIPILGSLGVAFSKLQTLMQAIVIFTAPGLLVVSMKALYNVANDE